MLLKDKTRKLILEVIFVKIVNFEPIGILQKKFKDTSDSLYIVLYIPYNPYSLMTE